MVNRTAVTADPAAAALYDKMRHAQTALMRQLGADNTFARTAHERLQSHGLVDAGRRSYAVCTTLLQTGGLLRVGRRSYAVCTTLLQTGGLLRVGVEG